MAANDFANQFSFTTLLAGRNVVGPERRGRPVPAGHDHAISPFAVQSRRSNDNLGRIARDHWRQQLSICCRSAPTGAGQVPAPPPALHLSQPTGRSAALPLSRSADDCAVANRTDLNRRHGSTCSGSNCQLTAGASPRTDKRSLRRDDRRQAGQARQRRRDVSHDRLGRCFSEYST